MNIGASFEDRDGFVGIGSLHNFKSGLLDYFRRIHQELVFVLNNQDDGTHMLHIKGSF